MFVSLSIAVRSSDTNELGRQGVKIVENDHNIIALAICRDQETSTHRNWQQQHALFIVFSRVAPLHPGSRTGSIKLDNRALQRVRNMTHSTG